MPFSRPSLSDLRTQAAQDIATALPGTDPLLRFSNLGILGQVMAALAHLHYGYLDWIAQQATPATAIEEFLEAWGGLKGITRLPATQATGTVNFGGTNGTVVPAGTQVVRSDGVIYTSMASATVTGGTAVVNVQAQADAAGLLGAFGNGPSGMSFTLGTTIAGVNAASSSASAFTGGADLESDDGLRARVFLAFQNAARGGSRADYVSWALAVAGVTRAWCVPNGSGPGTVHVFVMLDVAQAAYGGFPQGTDGVAATEVRDTPATGDQLAVANYIVNLQPVTALVYVKAPAPNTVDFTITGIASASTETKAAIAAAIRSVFQTNGQITTGTTTLFKSLLESAIAAVPNTAGFVITVPSGNIVSPSGQIPVLGTVVYI